MQTRPNNSPETRVFTKSALIDSITRQQPQLSRQDVAVAVQSIVDRMHAALVNGERIEIRGFGSMVAQHRSATVGRNPKTGEEVQVEEKYIPRFKPSTNLLRRINKRLPNSSTTDSL